MTEQPVSILERWRDEAPVEVVAEPSNPPVHDPDLVIEEPADQAA